MSLRGRVLDSPAVAQGLLVAFLVLIWGTATWWVARYAADAGELAVGLAYLTVQIGSHLWLFPRGRQRPRRVVIAVLLVQLAATFVPFTQFDWWLGTGVAAGSVMLLTPLRIGVPIALAISAAVGAARFWTATPGVEGFAAIGGVTTTVMTFVAVYALTRLVHLVDELDRTRDESADLAATRERLHAERELRGLLGARLSSILARTERIRDRDLQASGDDVAADIGKVIDESREALKDARSIAARGPDAEPNVLDSPAAGEVRISSRLAYLAVVVSFMSFAVLILAWAKLMLHDVRQVVIGTPVLAAILVIQLGYFVHTAPRARMRWHWLMLALQAVLVYVPTITYREFWLNLPGYLPASALLVLRPAASVPLTVVMLGSVGLLAAGDGSYPSNGALALNVVGTIVWTATSVIAMYAVMRLASLVAELDEARNERARLAVDVERARLARDTHDLLGISLSAVTLKAELTRRLLDRDPDLARAQLDEIADLTRKAIGEVRSVTSGQREFRLTDELASARSVLASAEIEARISTPDLHIPEPQSTVLAAVLREGVTNVLRHSRAERCAITLQRSADAVRLEILNGGAEPSPARDDGEPGGHGLPNLKQRVDELGGVITSGPEPGNTYRLTVELPVADPLLQGPSRASRTTAAPSPR